MVSWLTSRCGSNCRQIQRRTLKMPDYIKRCKNCDIAENLACFSQWSLGSSSCTSCGRCGINLKRSIPPHIPVALVTTFSIRIDWQLWIPRINKYQKLNQLAMTMVGATLFEDYTGSITCSHNCQYVIPLADEQTEGNWLFNTLSFLLRMLANKLMTHSSQNCLTK